MDVSSALCPQGTEDQEVCHCHLRLPLHGAVCAQGQGWAVGPGPRSCLRAARNTSELQGCPCGEGVGVHQGERSYGSEDGAWSLHPPCPEEGGPILILGITEDFLCWGKPRHRDIT